MTSSCLNIVESLFACADGLSEEGTLRGVGWARFGLVDDVADVVE